MGIVNLTTDSLSHAQLDKAADSDFDMAKVVDIVKGWVQRNAVDIVDVGAESTKPGAYCASSEGRS